MAVSIHWGSVLWVSPQLLFGVYIGAPDLWNTPIWPLAPVFDQAVERRTLTFFGDCLGTVLLNQLYLRALYLVGTHSLLYVHNSTLECSVA